MRFPLQPSPSPTTRGRCTTLSPPAPPLGTSRPPSTRLPVRDTTRYPLAPRVVLAPAQSLLGDPVSCRPSARPGRASASVHVPLWRSAEPGAARPTAGPQRPPGLLQHAGLRPPGAPASGPRLPLHQPAHAGRALSHGPRTHRGGMLQM